MTILDGSVDEWVGRVSIGAGITSQRSGEAMHCVFPFAATFPVRDRYRLQLGEQISYAVAIEPGDNISWRAPSAEAAARTTSAPEPTERTPMDEWIDNVNANGGNYGPADAHLSCERLDEYGGEAPWWAVGDDRLIWAGRLLCTQHKDSVERSVGGFRDGTHIVGKESGQVSPGTYVTRPGVENCYWERVSGGGVTIANSFTSFAPQGVRVSVRDGDAGLRTQGCGAWVHAE